MSLGPMKLVYLIRGWYWKRYWSQWLAGIIILSTTLLVILTVVGLATGRFQGRNERQDTRIEQLEQRVDSLSLQIEELKK
jgi:hypothetical protein